jgi:hypothetical protein
MEKETTRSVRDIAKSFNEKTSAEGNADLKEGNNVDSSTPQVQRDMRIGSNESWKRQKKNDISFITENVSVFEETPKKEEKEEEKKEEGKEEEKKEKEEEKIGGEEAGKSDDIQPTHIEKLHANVAGATHITQVRADLANHVCFDVIMLLFWVMLMVAPITLIIAHLPRGFDTTQNEAQTSSVREERAPPFVLSQDFRCGRGPGESKLRTIIKNKGYTFLESIRQGGTGFVIECPPNVGKRLEDENDGRSFNKRYELAMCDEYDRLQSTDEDVCSYDHHQSPFARTDIDPKLKENTNDNKTWFLDACAFEASERFPLSASLAVHFINVFIGKPERVSRGEYFAMRKLMFSDTNFDPLWRHAVEDKLKEYPQCHSNFEKEDVEDLSNVGGEFHCLDSSANDPLQGSWEKYTAAHGKTPSGVAWNAFYDSSGYCGTKALVWQEEVRWKSFFDCTCKNSTVTNVDWCSWVKMSKSRGRLGHVPITAVLWVDVTDIFRRGVGRIDDFGLLHSYVEGKKFLLGVPFFIDSDEYSVGIQPRYLRPWYWWENITKSMELTRQLMRKELKERAKENSFDSRIAPLSRQDFSHCTEAVGWGSSIGANPSEVSRIYWKLRRNIEMSKGVSC